MEEFWEGWDGPNGMGEKEVTLGIVLKVIPRGVSFLQTLNCVFSGCIWIIEARGLSSVCSLEINIVRT